MTPRFKYLTINAFRREFFAAGSRPRKSDIMRWIDGGTLPAIKIDGVVYIHTDDAAAFFTGAAYHTAPAQDTACKKDFLSAKNRETREKQGSNETRKTKKTTKTAFL